MLLRKGHMKDMVDGSKFCSEPLLPASNGWLPTPLTDGHQKSA